MSDWRPRDPTGGDSGAAPPPPGWGSPFPPEKPRRDAPAGAQQASQPPAVNPYQPVAPYTPTPYGAAPATPPSSPPYGAAPGQYGAPAGYSSESYATAAVPGVPIFAPLPDPMTENRRHLDWRRIRATRFDGFLMVPPSVGILLLFHKHIVTAYFLILALNLVYHFVAETLFGQTIGKSRRNLRVVKRDGTPAGASAIAARTVFRIIDAQFLYLVGLLTMVITGKKRQRLGDLAAGTIVREDDRPWKPARSSPLLAIYPAVWIAGALFFGHMLDPKPVKLTSDPYMQQVDRVCMYRTFSERVAGAGISFQSIQDLSVQETRAIADLPAPTTPDAAYEVKAVLKWRHKIDKTAARIAADARASQNPQGTFRDELPRLEDVIKRSDKHMAAFGLPHCIEGPGYITTY
jgi:uncharacterized RDD family membrane protein YckC